MQFVLQFGLRLLMPLLAFVWFLFSHCIWMLRGLYAPAICPCHCFSILLSPLLAFCYPIHCLCTHVRDGYTPQLVVLKASVPLLLSLLYPHHDSQPRCLLTGCLGFQQVCQMSNCSVQLSELAVRAVVLSVPCGSSSHWGLPGPCSSISMI